VIAIEGGKLTPHPTRNDMLIGTDSVDGLNVAFSYEFLEGRLARGWYGLVDKHSEPGAYLIDAQRMANAIAGKYGPAEHKVLWKNRLYSDDPLKYGFAISAGHLSVSDSWETERTRILQ